MKPAAIVFDLYGTLLRITALRERVAASGIAQADAFVDVWRAKQIEYSWCASLMEDYRDFDTLTRKALDYTLGAFATALPEERQAELAGAWLELEAYDDVSPALARLRALGAPLAVLTNGVRASAEKALRHAAIRDALDDVLSVESVRVYKPDPRVYRLVTARYACEPERVAFVSSNGWDATGAAAFGFQVAWCNRAGKPPETLGFAPAAAIGGLAELDAFVG